MNEADPKGLLTDKDWEDIKAAAAGHILADNPESTLEDLRKVDPSSVTEELKAIYEIVTSFRNSVASPLKFCISLIPWWQRIQSQELKYLLPKQTPSQWGKKAKQMESALLKAQKLAIEIFESDMTIEETPQPKIEPPTLGEIKLTRNMDRHKPELIEGEYVSFLREKEPGEWDLGVLWYIEAIDALRRKAHDIAFEAELQKTYRIDYVQWQLNRASDICTGYDIPISKSPRSRFYRIVEWLLPDTTDVSYRIGKVKEYRKLQESPSLLRE